MAQNNSNRLGYELLPFGKKEDNVTFPFSLIVLSSLLCFSLEMVLQMSNFTNSHMKSFILLVGD